MKNLSSMEAFSREPNRRPLSKNDKSESENEENYSKLDCKFPGLGSSKISKVSTLKLKSFVTSSFTDIHDSPFSLNGKSFTKPREMRFSDGEQELNRFKSLGKYNDSNEISYTFPRARYRKSSSKQSEEDKAAKEALKNLPSSPFPMFQRFALDTEKMQIESKGSMDKSLMEDFQKDSSENKPEFSSDMDKDDEISDNGSASTLTQQHVDDAQSATSSGEIKSHLPRESFSNSLHDSPDDIVIAPPDNFRDNTSNRKFISRPNINIASLKTLESKTDHLIEVGDSVQLNIIDKFLIPEVVPPPPEEINNNTDIENNNKKPVKRSRPKLPVTMLKEAPAPTIPISSKEEIVPDCDELPKLVYSEVEKVGSAVFNKRSRPRPLAQTPILEGIPEEKGSGNRKNSNDRHFKTKSKRKSCPSPDCVIIENVEKDAECESPKTDEKENGYFSDMHSTPKDLSYEDLSVDLEPEIEYKNAPVRSKSDPMPADLSKDETILIDGAISGHTKNKQSSKSDSNISKLSKDTGLGSTTSIDSSGKFGTASVTSNEDSGLETPSTTPTTPLLPTTPTEDAKSIPKSKTPKAEMRQHVLQNLLDTENSYVQNLSAMIKLYYEPLKKPERGDIIEAAVVDEIFYQIPNILYNHETFLEQLKNRVDAWSDEQIIGDIIVESFTKCLLMDAYSNFINHFVQAKEAIRNATNARPLFQKYIEQCSKDHKEKLTLSDLLIMPVQRIPRYVMILNDMLKYTPLEHPDYRNLQLALGEIKTLASRMNKGELEADQAEKDMERLRDIEQTIEGIPDLVISSRKFIRQDLVAEVKSQSLTVKKDRCLFLFSDLLVCATVRRKNNALRRTSLGLFSGQSAADINRYRFIWKYPLDDVEISKGHNSLPKVGGKEMEAFEKDMKVLENISILLDTLQICHVNIDHMLKEMKNNLAKEMKDLQLACIQTTPTLSPAQSRIDIQAQTDEGTKLYTFHFLSSECKSSWEAYFEDAKQKLAYSRDSFPPEFKYAMPITKTRSGMQFTCASPSHVTGSPNMNQVPATACDVWVCNSDGYVGQVCLLALVPEPESKASISVCSARIVCIAAVPGGRLFNSKNSGVDNNNTSSSNRLNSMDDSISIHKRTKRSKLPPNQIKHKKSFESDEYDMHHKEAESIMAFDEMTSDDDEDNDISGSRFSVSSIFAGRMSPDGSSEGTAESAEGEPESSEDDYSSDDDDDEPRISTSTIPDKSPISPISRGASDYSISEFVYSENSESSTMWLGTEDGYLYIYHANETISTQRKSKKKLHVGSPVTCILYFENKVFVALGNGELCIFEHETNNNGWQIYSPQRIQVSLTASDLSCMTAVAGRIWCGCQHQIILVNASSLKIENTINVGNDTHRSIFKVVSSGLGVWVSLQSSSVIHLYHATTYENLTDIDVSSAVHKMLAGADAIIRQHKAACLRVTSLVICKDLLWIGTSAGVILTNPLPSITASTSVLRHSPGPTGSPHGHTGHVRFLTSVEVSKYLFNKSDFESYHKISKGSDSSNFKNGKENISKNNTTDSDSNATITLVVSGGDGYEDFRYNQQTEAVGRDDSTNHLLIWRV